MIGTVVATRKDDRLIGAKLLIAQPVDPGGAPDGTPLVAVDMVGAGMGETVLLATGSVAARAYSGEGAPVDAVVVGIVDAIEQEGGRP